VESKSEQTKLTQLRNLGKVSKAKIATLEAVLKEKNVHEAKMGVELKNMKGAQAKSVQEAKDAAILAEKERKNAAGK